MLQRPTILKAQPTSPHELISDNLALLATDGLKRVRRHVSLEEGVEESGFEAGAEIEADFFAATGSGAVVLHWSAGDALRHVSWGG